MQCHAGIAEAPTLTQPVQFITVIKKKKLHYTRSFPIPAPRFFPFYPSSNNRVTLRNLSEATRVTHLVTRYKALAKFPAHLAELRSRLPFLQKPWLHILTEAKLQVFLDPLKHLSAKVQPLLENEKLKYFCPGSCSV